MSGSFHCVKESKTLYITYKQKVFPYIALFTYIHIHPQKHLVFIKMTKTVSYHNFHTLGGRVVMSQFTY